MKSYDYQCIAPKNGQPLQMGLLIDSLQDACVKRGLPVESFRIHESISDEDVRRQPGGLVIGLPVPLVMMVTLRLPSNVSREEARTKLQEAIADIGRPDVTVANA